MATITRQVDASAWPLVVLKPSQFATEGSALALGDALCALLERNERFCMLGDFTHKTSMELHEVRNLSELFQSQGERLDAHLAALGLAVPSALVRGAIKLVFQARRPKYPYSVLRTRRDAKRYVDAHLAQLIPSPTLSTAVGH